MNCFYKDSKFVKKYIFFFLGGEGGVRGREAARVSEFFFTKKFKSKLFFRCVCGGGEGAGRGGLVGGEGG